MTYVVDSDVFITAKNQYYSFDICPGFWKSVVHHHRDGRVFSVDRVRGELLAGHPKEDLVRWVRNEVPEGFFLPVDTAEVMSAYTDIMMWVQHHPKPGCRLRRRGYHVTGLKRHGQRAMPVRRPCRLIHALSRRSTP